MDYIAEPDAIYARSFQRIREQCDFSTFAAPARAIAERMVHACAMTDIVADLVIDADLPERTRQALYAGRPVLCDCEMVRCGIIARLLPQGAHIVCTLNDPRARDIGRAGNITRSAAAVSLWRDRLDGAVAVIGNAPTALFALLEMIDAGAPAPAVIIATPVGFVGAAEAKAELVRERRGAAIATLAGRRGGSALAAAAFNAVFACPR